MAYHRRARGAERPARPRAIGRDGPRECAARRAAAGALVYLWLEAAKKTRSLFYRDTRRRFRESIEP